MSDSKSLEKLNSLVLDEEDYLTLLAKVIGFTKSLQNNPPELVPQEKLVADAIVEYLKPFSGDDTRLSVKVCEYVAGRPNVIIRYQGEAKDKIVSYVGSHMDVVPADPAEWERDPFTLVREGDMLYGRGVTDCLGHVVLLAQFFKQLVQNDIVLQHSVAAVLIANEENSSIPGIGIDELQKHGELDFLKHGPLIWLDSANFGPTLGTGGVQDWEMVVNGKLFHSGLPHKAINTIYLANEVLKYIEERFYADFTKHAEMEKKYLFSIGSTFKATQFNTDKGSFNQIPGRTTVAGDIRFTPFYHPDEVRAAIEKYVAELDVEKLESRGFATFSLPDEDLKGSVDFKWHGDPYPGVAVNMESPGFKALKAAVELARGKAEPYSITGSLPIIRDLQDAGYDVQIIGFGRMEAYHANNEFGVLSEFAQGFRILAHVPYRMDSDSA
jgi:acetylornithine deacetylase